MIWLWTKRPRTDEQLDEQLQGYRPDSRMRSDGDGDQQQQFATVPAQGA